LAQVEGIKKYANFQSNLAYLKNPPRGYFEAPIDVMSRLDAVSAALNAGTYKSEIEFETAVLQLFHDTHDGHFYLRMGGLTVFSFVQNITLTSVSLDGIQLPKIYHADDILNDNKNASSVVSVNGQPVGRYFSNFATNFGFGQEPDVNYNSIFLGQGNGGPRRISTPTFNGYFSSRTLYDGANFTISFANGTTLTEPWYARLLSDFSGVSSGEDYYQVFIRQPALEVVSNIF
jgi:hypothetical protein